MKGNPVLYKTLVVGVIVLFIGVGIQPAFAVTTNNSDNEDDCNLCLKVSSLHLVRLKSLLKREETLNNKLSVVSKQNPIVIKRYQEFSNKISSIAKQIKILDHNSVFNKSKTITIYICDILSGFMILYATLLSPLDILSQILEEIGLLMMSEILYKFYEILFIPLIPIVILWVGLCLNIHYHKEL